jgi:hypothetical protein
LRLTAKTPRVRLFAQRSYVLELGLDVHARQILVCDVILVEDEVSIIVLVVLEVDSSAWRLRDDPTRAFIDGQLEPCTTASPKSVSSRCIPTPIIE